MKRKKVTILDLKNKKGKGEPITMLTAYDYPTGLLVDQAGIDIILVGDSLAMVVLGHENTVAVTMDEMLHHCKAVARGAKNPLLVGDMPFMSYQVDVKEAIRNAGRFLKEGGMDVVKLEGGRDMAPTVKGIVDAGIPVMGHIGLTPQTISKLGGYRVQGKDVVTAKALIDDGLALEEAGAFSLILEAIPGPVARLITERVGIPTIGIGAGPDCDGQVLVTHDLIGLFDRFVPKFVKQYTNTFSTIIEALESYRDEVVAGTFPGPEHGYSMSDEALQALLKEFGE
ncbi:MAG: 3-methyl-2-oxobutanoate hydroxymethyltransferase [Anaerolineae bacterium]|nr:3-methyl-2-oxobutanoate hydroxymethyltransferase [Anaerolineae bacterium]MCK4449728.1 3-methyl-2-oxobutanoate hydroxymethyltransferase [Anaerolineae bacterium]